MRHQDVAGCNSLYSLWLREVVLGCIVQRQENGYLLRILSNLAFLPRKRRIRPENCVTKLVQVLSGQF